MSSTLKSALVLVVGVFFAVGAGADDKTKADDKTRKDDKPYTDAEFVKKAANCGMHEVELGKLAAAQGKSEEVKKFGQKMVDDHMKANDELKVAAKKANLEVPTKIDDEHQKHIDRLKPLKGDEFDKAYIKHTIEDHEKAVAALTTASKEAKDAGIKEFATKTLPVVQKHLDEAKKLDKK